MDENTDKETVDKPPTIRLTAGCAMAVGKASGCGEEPKDQDNKKEEN